MSYLDKVQRSRLEYIEALGAADTANQKALEIARLLPARRDEAREESFIERIQRSNKAVKERQAAQESAAPAPPQDEGVMSMAPPEMQVTGAQRLGIGGGANVETLKEVFGGGGRGVQPAGRAGGQPAGQPAAAGPGQLATQRTTTTTQPSAITDPRLHMMARMLAPQLLEPRTVTQTQTVTGRDPELFQANVVGLATAMDAARTTGDHRRVAELARGFESTYGTPYAMQVARVAKITDQTNQMARFRQIPAEAIDLSETYGLDNATAMAAARAKADGDYETYQKIISEEKPLVARAREAEIERVKAATSLLKEQMLAERVTRERGMTAINAVSNSTRMFGTSMTAGFHKRYGGEEGQVDPKTAFRLLGEVLDDDGRPKKSETLTIQGLRHYFADKGLALVLEPDQSALEKLAGGITSSWSSKDNKTLLVPIDEIQGMIERQDHRSLEALNLGYLKRPTPAEKEAGVRPKFIWVDQEKPFDWNAELTWGLRNLADTQQRLGGEFKIQIQRGGAQVVQEGTAPEPAPAPTPAPPPQPAGPSLRQRLQEFLNPPRRGQVAPPPLPGATGPRVRPVEDFESRRR